MSTLTDKLKAMAAYKGVPRGQQVDTTAPYDEQHMAEGFICGAQWEHARLAPLLEAYNACVEALLPVSECGNCGGCRDSARQALARLQVLADEGA